MSLGFASTASGSHTHTCLPLSRWHRRFSQCAAHGRNYLVLHVGLFQGSGICVCFLHRVSRSPHLDSMFASNFPQCSNQVHICLSRGPRQPYRLAAVCFWGCLVFLGKQQRTGTRPVLYSFEVQKLSKRPSWGLFCLSPHRQLHRITSEPHQ